MQKFIQRADGSEVRITANYFLDIGMEPAVDLFVHHRKSSSAPWELASDRPHPDWRKMSVSEYIERGRSEVLRLVSPGEILQMRAAAQNKEK